MIIWVGERCKPLLARRAIVLKIEMITWVCGTVGLWDSDSNSDCLGFNEVER